MSLHVVPVSLIPGIINTGHRDERLDATSLTPRGKDVASNARQRQSKSKEKRVHTSKCDSKSSGDRSRTLCPAYLRTARDESGERVFISQRCTERPADAVAAASGDVCVKLCSGPSGQLNRYGRALVEKLALVV